MNKAILQRLSCVSSKTKTEESSLRNTLVMESYSIAKTTSVLYVGYTNRRMNYITHTYYSYEY